MTKVKAFTSHLGISLIIFLGILSLLIFAWFPPPFFTSDGGWQGIRIIAGVDLVLGPLLTLIVFKPGKPGLKFDLSVIGLMQLSALAWGIWMLHHERPVAAVYADNYFAPVSYSDIKPFGMTRQKFQMLGDKPPYWIFSDLPKNPDKLQKVRISALRRGLPMSRLVEYYKPIDAQAMREIRDKSIDMQRWLKNKPAELKRYRQFLAEHGGGEELVFLPWRARKHYEIIALDSKTRKYVGTLDLWPPKDTTNFPMLGTKTKHAKTLAQHSGSDT